MFRIAPDHALYQGDIIVVPIVTSSDRDPTVITEVTQDQLRFCPRCQTAYAQPFTPRTARVCPNETCGAPERVPRGEKRYQTASARVRALGRGALDGARIAASLEVVPAMILSHTCDIDNARHIRMAPLGHMTRFRPEQAESIRRREGYFSYFYLEPWNELEEGVVDLDRQFFVPATLLGTPTAFDSKKTGRRDGALAPYVEAIASRVFSLNLYGLQLLYKQMIRHMVRPGQDQIKIDPPEEAILDDPDRPQRQALPTQGWWWPYSGWPRKPQQSELML
jgi:hypothetical protein